MLWRSALLLGTPLAHVGNESPFEVGRTDSSGSFHPREAGVFNKKSIARDFYLKESINLSSFIFKFTLMFYRQHYLILLKKH